MCSCYREMSILCIRTGISNDIPRPEYRILCELQVLELIADRNVLLWLNLQCVDVTEIGIMLSLVTASEYYVNCKCLSC